MNRTLENGLAVMELLDKEPSGLGVREVARRLDMSPASVQRLINSLEELGYLEQVREARTYRLSFKAFFLGHSTLRSDRLTSAAIPELERLTTHHKVSAYLAVRRETRAVYLQVLEGHGFVATHVAPGQSTLLHVTAMGKVLLSAMSDEDVRALYPDGVLERPTSKSVSDLPELLAQLAHIRREGIAYIIEENLFGIAAIGAPIRDYTGNVIASVSIAIPTSSHVDEELKRLSGVLREVCERISDICGFKSNP